MISIKKSDEKIDVTFFPCPIPLLRIKGALGRLSSGQTLEVNGILATHVHDFEEWCVRNNHYAYDKEAINNQLFRIFIKKG